MLDKTIISIQNALKVKIAGTLGIKATKEWTSFYIGTETMFLEKRKRETWVALCFKLV